jgi:hypothetical protein
MSVHIEWMDAAHTFVTPLTERDEAADYQRLDAGQLGLQLCDDSGCVIVGTPAELGLLIGRMLSAFSQLLVTP